MRQSASPIGGPPCSIPAARAGAVYLRSVLRSTPRLADSSCCDRPAYQWIKISTMSTTTKVLLAKVCSHLAAGQRGGACGLPRTRPGTNTHVLPWGNSVTVRWGNYVIVNPSQRGKFLIADSREPAGRRSRGSSAHCWPRDPPFHGPASGPMTAGSVPGIAPVRSPSAHRVNGEYPPCGIERPVFGGEGGGTDSERPT